MNEPVLIKGLQADYTPAVWSGKNTSGLKTFGKNILVLVDECAAVTAGGIMVTDDRAERMTAISTTGVLIQVGPEAFRLFDDGTVWQGDRPRAGDRIWFEKYAGQLQTGRDGKTYRLMDYRALAAVAEEEEA